MLAFSSLNRNSKPISSAGVFNSSGQLVRTIWSAQTNDSRVANPVAAWDGTLDDATLHSTSRTVAPTGDYTIKVLQNNIKYAWDGVVGNSSPTSEHLYKVNYINPSDSPNDMEVNPFNGEIYFVSAYHEKFPTVHVMQPNDITHTTYVLGTVATGQIDTANRAHQVCTDGNNFYISEFPAGTPAGYMQAVSCATKLVPFNVNGHEFFGSGTVGTGGSGDYISGLAVQQNSNFLFAARAHTGVGYIEVYNKTNGAFVNTFNGLNGAYQLCVNRNTDDLWVIYSSGPAPFVFDQVAKCTVDGSGNITATATVITGFQYAVAIDISPDGTTLLVVDSGLDPNPSQQVKAFNTSDGSVKTAFATNGVLGQLGGYKNSVAVTDDRFLFFYTGFAGGGMGGYIAYCPDGSFWLGDGGTFRNLHFSAGNSPTVLERFSYTGTSYSAAVCRGDDTSVFLNWMEYRIDYSKPLDAGNGSWTPLNNWGHFIFNNPDFRDSQGMLYQVGIWANGRRYCRMVSQTTNRQWHFELTPTGLRQCNSSLTHGDSNLNNQRDYDNNWVFPLNVTSASSTAQIRINRFAGFDGNNDPFWVHDATVNPPQDVLATVTTLPVGFPSPSGKNPVTSAGGVLPIYLKSTFLPSFDSNHFGGINVNTGLWMFNTHPASAGSGSSDRFGTRVDGGLNYGMLEMSEPPYFSLGGGGADGYGVPQVFNRPDIPAFFTCQNDELWAGGQNNFWSHWHENGLLIGQFGTVGGQFAAPSVQTQQPDFKNGVFGPRIDAANQGSPWFKGLPGHAGNVNAGGIALQNGKYYLYHNDEWFHSGLHRWSVDNLQSIQITSFPVSWDSSTYVAPTLDPNDLLAGLPFATFGVTGLANWSANVAEGANLHTITNARSNDRRLSPDIYINGGKPLRNWIVSRTIPRTLTGNWSLDTIISWTGNGSMINVPFVAQGENIIVEIVDGSGKSLLQISSDSHQDTSPVSFRFCLYANHTPATVIPLWAEAPGTSGQANSPFQPFIAHPRPLLIQATVGSSTFDVTFNGKKTAGIPLFDPTADLVHPAKLQVRYNIIAGTNASGAGGSVDFNRLYFSES